MGDFADNSLELFGNGEDGDLTISVDTDLGSANNKNYTRLTINSGKNLTGNSGVIIRVQSILNIVGTIHTDGKSTGTGAPDGNNSTASSNSGGGGGGGGSLVTLGGVGGTSNCGSAASGGTLTDSLSTDTLTVYNNKGGKGGKAVTGSNTAAAAGLGGGTLKIFAWNIIGTGTISANGTAGTAGSNGGAGLQGGGGGGGGAGGYIRVFSGNDISGLTIRANGGNGGKGGDKSGGGLGAGGGGGGGGSGGLCSIFYNNTSSATLTCSVGTAGAAGALTANPKSDAADGTKGVKEQFVN